MEKLIYDFTVGTFGYTDRVYILEDDNQFIVDYEVDKPVDEIDSLYIPKDCLDNKGNAYQINATDAFLQAMEHYWYEKLQREGKCE